MESLLKLPSILYIVDANSFASLALLNRKWRRISDSEQLYAYHLSRCPSFSLTRGLISGPLTSEDLPRLKGRFACETRRNAFEVFLRPRKTLIKLIAASVSSSTAFPFGEAFRFCFSANGQMLLGLSSSRIFVIDLSSRLVNVKQELKTLRKPLGATILDDGSLLAVVSSKHQVNIYRLTDEEARHIQVLTLDEAPRTLALSPTGSVVAIAYDNGIEVCSVGENVLATERRAMRCTSVDSLSFSSDGTLLLGSSTDTNKAIAVAISAPFNTEAEMDLATRDAEIHMWTRQILFPDIIPGYTHVSLLPHHLDGDGSWVIGYDNHLKTFRVVRADNARTGVIYFVGPSSNGSLQETNPLIAPATDSRGELIALGFHGSGLWLYGLPDRYDVAPSLSLSLQMSSATDSGRDPIDRNLDERSSYLHHVTSRLQRSINQPRILLQGNKLTDIRGITAAQWVSPKEVSYGNRPAPRRLVAVAPGGVASSILCGENLPIDGGRILVMDFERSPTDGETNEITIEVGETEPKLLREQNPSLDTEVELERRRTQSHRTLIGSPRRGSRRASAARESFPAATGSSQKLLSSTRRASHSQPSTPTDTDPIDFAQSLDSPYDNTQPRSRDTLQRAATAAAVSWSRYNPRYRDAGNSPVIERQIPHESDADNWVPPPPPYSREPDAPLPDHLRRLLLPVAAAPGQNSNGTASQSETAVRSHIETIAQSPVTRSRTTIDRMNTISGSRLFLRRRSSTESPIFDHGWRNYRQRSTLQVPSAHLSSNFTNNGTSAGASQVLPANHPLEQHSVAISATTVTPQTSDHVHHDVERDVPSATLTDEVRDLGSLSGQIITVSPGPSIELSTVGATLQEPLDLPVPLLSESETASHLIPDSSLPLPETQREPQRSILYRRRTRSRPRSLVPRLLSPSRNQKRMPSLRQSRVPAVPPGPLQLQNDRSTTNYHTYSISSPDLRVRQSQRNQLDAIRDADPNSRRHGSNGVSRRRSNDALGPIPPGNRASTDPLDGRLQRDRRTEDWRLQIEQWNARTINERREKHSKCTVM